MTRTELTNKISHAKVILGKLSIRLKNYLNSPDQANAKIINKICDCSYKIGVMESYVTRLESKLYSR